MRNFLLAVPFEDRGIFLVLASAAAALARILAGGPITFLRGGSVEPGRIAVVRSITFSRGTSGESDGAGAAFSTSSNPSSSSVQTEFLFVLTLKDN
jgi:hypothetical protein